VAKPQPTGSVVEGTAPPAGFASWRNLLKVQEKMNAAAATITAATKGKADSGFAGLVADPTQRELKVYWKGHAPAGLIADVRATVPVSVLSAAYSARELSAASARVLAKGGDAVSTVGPRADGSGLLVGTRDGPTTTSSFTDYAGVPVTVEQGVSPPAAATRWDDTAPWWGGGVWVPAGASFGCSTGFAVFHAGAQRMLSAGHCGNVGQVATDPTGQPIGPIIHKVAAADTMIIDGDSDGHVFNNSTDAAGGVVTEFSNPVIGATASQVGNFVCTTGAFSGTRCSIRVTARDLCVRVRDVGTICGEVRGEQTARTNAGGNGDSGGPVEIVSASDPTKVFATGIFSALDDVATVVPCTGFVLSGRTCAWRIYYLDIFTAVASVGATGVILG
jgi:hypothetical protein